MIWDCNHESLGLFNGSGELLGTVVIWLTYAERLSNGIWIGLHVYIPNLGIVWNCVGFNGDTMGIYLGILRKRAYWGS
jgi:hypothetical protein